jgi:hypothetical protein
MLRALEDRQRDKQPLPHIGKQWAKVGDVLEHIPQAHGLGRSEIGIEPEISLLQPIDTVRIDIVTISYSALTAPPLDECTAADPNVDKLTLIVEINQLATGLHQRAPDIAVGLTGKAVEIVAVVRRDACRYRVIADADFRPPRQAARGKNGVKLTRLAQAVNCCMKSGIVLAQEWDGFVHRQKFRGQANPM